MEAARVTDHDVSPGEPSSEPDLGVDAVLVVTNAALEGLPAGVGVNELLMSNGERSFSLIMSGPTQVVPEVLADFIVFVSESVTPTA